MNGLTFFKYRSEWHWQSEYDDDDDDDDDDDVLIINSSHDD